MSTDQAAIIYDKLKAYCQEHNIELDGNNFDEALKKALTKEEYALLYLPETIAGQIDQFSMRGDLLLEQGQFAEAIELYQQGLAIIPEPKSTYESTLWFLVAIGDAYWYLREWEHALPYFEQSLKVAGGANNPFVCLRKGQLLYEMGDLVAAQKELNRGYEMEGAALFEDEAPKYLHLAQAG
jgi:tetratricopeptide (TPR) repeat protein